MRGSPENSPAKAGIFHALKSGVCKTLVFDAMLYVKSFDPFSLFYKKGSSLIDLPTVAYRHHQDH